MKSKTKRIVLLSILLSVAIVFGYLESLIPTIPIPGVKLGLANIVVLLTISNFKWYESLLIALLRIVLVSIILGSFMNLPFYMSLSGGLLSFLVMTLLTMLNKKINKLSILFISICGSVSHSIGQICIAMVLMDTVLVIYYLPFILLLSIPTGIIIGIVVTKLNKMEFMKDLSKYEKN